MKTLNLIIAIIYTVILTFIGMSGLAEGDMEMIMGVIFLSGPTVVNWVTYRNLK